MPDGSVSSPVYPSFQPAAQTNMLSNPGQALGLLSGLQDYRLKAAQFNALSQQPAAALEGQQLSNTGQGIANATALQGQQEAAAKVINRTMGGYLSGIKNPTADDVRSAAAFAARQNPEIAVRYPDTITEASRVGRQNPGLLTNSILSPESQSSRVDVTDPGSGSRFSVPVTSANTGGAIPTGLSPAAAATNERSGQAYASASENAGNYAQRINPLRQAIPILEGMKDTDIGPLSDKWNEIKSTAVNLGVGPLLGIDPNKIANNNELKKYFSQYSVQAGAALGPHTNDGLAAAVTSNPNTKMDKLSAVELSKVALGVERMRQAGVLEFNDKVDRGEADPSNFNKFMVDWGTKQDPRAFVYDLMTKEQQDKIKKGLPPAELKKIRDGMSIADRHGLLGDVHQ